MICPNCGGEHAEWVQKCPYCGSVNELGDERVYMEHMESIRARLDKVDEEGEEYYQRNVNTSVKTLGKRIGKIVLAVLLLVAVFVAFKKFQESRYSDRSMKELLWQKEEFPKLDALYEAGDYDGIIAAYYEENSDFGYYDWSHYYFVFEYYMPYKYMVQVRNSTKIGELPDSYTLGEAIEAMVRFNKQTDEKRLETLMTSYKANNGAYGITREEADIIRGYKEEARDFVSFMGYSEAEFEEICKRVMIDDMDIDLSACFDLAEELLEEMR